MFLAAGVPGPRGGQGASHRPHLLPPRHLNLVTSLTALIAGCGVLKR